MSLTGVPNKFPDEIETVVGKEVARIKALEEENAALKIAAMEDGVGSNEMSFQGYFDMTRKDLLAAAQEIDPEVKSNAPTVNLLKLLHESHFSSKEDDE